MRERARCSFARICHHEDGSLFELRLRTGITKLVFIDWVAIIRLLLGFPEEEMKRASAMMLRNKICNLLW